METHKSDCPCPQHTPPAGVRPTTLEKAVGHVRKGSTFFKGGFEMTDSEFDSLMRQFVLGPLQTAEPEEQADPAPQEQAKPESVTNEMLLQALQAFAEYMRNAKAPVVNVDVKPELKMPEVEERTILRDERTNQITGSRTVRRSQD